MIDLAAIALTRIDGRPDRLAAHLGTVLLIVNVASGCGRFAPGVTPDDPALIAAIEAAPAA